jgi:hypothetical protein
VALKNPRHNSEKKNQGEFYSEKLLLEEGSISDVIQKYPDAKVIMIGENHSDVPVRHALYAEAKNLHEQGIRSFAIEGSSEHQELLSRLGKGTVVDLYHNHDTNNILRLHPNRFDDRSYADAIYALSSIGMKVFAIDSPLNGSGISTEERESYMHEGIKNMALA